MPKIGDWNRVYWSNADGTNVLNRLDEDVGVTDETLAMYENQHGDIVEYGYAPDESDGDYYVALNNSIVENVVLDGEKFDEQEFEQLVVSTRARAREAATQLMRQLPPLVEDEDGNFDYDALQSWAKVIGVPANQSHEDLQDKVVRRSAVS